jgi:hypothetical protein
MTTEDLQKFIRDGRNYAILEAERPDLALERKQAEVAMTRQLRALEFDPKAVIKLLNHAVRHITYNGHDIQDFAAAVEILHSAERRCRL